MSDGQSESNLTDRTHRIKTTIQRDLKFVVDVVLLIGSIEKAFSHALVLQLTPRSKDTQNDLSRLPMLIDTASLHLRMLRVDLPGDAWTHYQFDAVQLNVSIPDHTLDIDIPSDAHIVEPYAGSQP